LARNCRSAYRLADPQTRRLFNQVFFSKIFVDAVDAPAPTVAGVELTSPFAELAARNQPHGEADGAGPQAAARRTINNVHS
jgi:hypothetical protein